MIGDRAQNPIQELEENARYQYSHFYHIFVFIRFFLYFSLNILYVACNMEILYYNVFIIFELRYNIQIFILS